jgi:hypothetical protein
MYQGNFSDKLVHARIFLNYLELAIKLVEQKQHINAIAYNKMYADNRFNINKIKIQWEGMLSTLKADYSTAESRAFIK